MMPPAVDTKVLEKALQSNAKVLIYRRNGPFSDVKGIILKLTDQEVVVQAEGGLPCTHSGDRVSIPLDTIDGMTIIRPEDP